MNIWAIILAAGGSVRFGGPKALASWEQGTLLSHAVDIATTAFGKNVLMVTGGHKLPALAETVFNNDWQSGLGSSVAAGLKAVKDKNADICVIMPVDQPLITPDHLRALAKKAAQENAIVLSRDRMVDGPPAALSKNHFAVLDALQGDRGLKSVIKTYIVIDALGMLVDVDTPDDLAALKASRAKA